MELVRTSTTPLGVTKLASGLLAKPEKVDDAVASYELGNLAFFAFVCLSFFSPRLAITLFFGENFEDAIKRGEDDKVRFGVVAKALVFAELNTSNNSREAEQFVFVEEMSCRLPQITITDTLSKEQFTLPRGIGLEQLRLKALQYLTDKMPGNEITVVYDEKTLALKITDNTTDKTVELPYMSFDSFQNRVNVLDEVVDLFYDSNQIKIAGIDQELGAMYYMYASFKKELVQRDEQKCVGEYSEFLTKHPEQLEALIEMFGNPLFHAANRYIDRCKLLSDIACQNRDPGKRKAYGQCIDMVRIIYGALDIANKNKGLRSNVSKHKKMDPNDAY